MEAATMPSHPLGQHLLDQGLLTDSELDEAILCHELTGRRLGAILVERGYVSPTDLAGALAEQFGIGLDEDDTPPAPRRRHLRLVGPDEQPNVFRLPLPGRMPAYDPLTRLEAAIGRTTAGFARAAAHVLFAPAERGYILAGADGPPPAQGSSLVLDGASLTVAKLGRSPLPGDARPCAYLRR